MSGSSTIVNMTLDADLQSYFGSAYTWFRVSANGVQLADANGSAVYNNTDVNGVNTYTYDLSAFAGQAQVYIKFEASCKYGAGSKWCIAATGGAGDTNTHFDNYSKHSNFYLL